MPSVMIMAMLAGIGLVPAAESHGIGSETAKPLATRLTLFGFPLIV